MGAYTSRIYTVHGITASLCALTKRFGVHYPTAHARMFVHGWTVEQALGLAPRPAPKAHNTRRILPALVDGPRLVPAAENFLDAFLTLVIPEARLNAEEYLRREGVPLNEHPLRPFNHW